MHDLSEDNKAYLTEDEYNKFKIAIQNCLYSRDRAIAHLVLHDGLRLRECLALNRDSIVNIYGQPCLMIKGKNARSIRLSDHSLKALTDWLISKPNITSGALFFTKNGDRITPVAVDNALKRIGRSARLNISARLLRNTFIVRALSSGLDVHTVQCIVGQPRAARLAPHVLQVNQMQVAQEHFAAYNQSQTTLAQYQTPGSPTPL